MDTIEYRYLDKSTWGDGSWQDEPDKVQWPDRATGLPCLAVRNRMGSWCGYVGVAGTHPWFGLDPYGRIDRQPENDHSYDPASRPDELISVHGGLTFAGACDPNATEERGICHKPSPGEPDHVWWLGFDCGHAYDYCPNYRPLVALAGERSTYRTLAYVQEQCAQLAVQLVAVQP